MTHCICHTYNRMLLRFDPAAFGLSRFRWTRDPNRATQFATHEEARTFQTTHHLGEHEIEPLDAGRRLVRPGGVRW